MSAASVADAPTTEGPDPLGSFVGNQNAIALVRAVLSSDRFVHAYLITGPEQVGKRTLARAMAAALLCAAATARDRAGNAGPNDCIGARIAPCGACRNCRLVARDGHPDARLVAPEPGRRGVTIEQVRQLEHAASLRPYAADWKVLMVCDVDSMAEPAANALLKTLEEPPADTVLILTAGDAASVLPTIASRCREVPLRPVPAPAIAAALEARGVAKERAQLLASLSSGRPGWALDAAADPAKLAAREAFVAGLEQLLQQSRLARLQSAGELADPATSRALLDTWLGWWRDALLVQQGAQDLVTNADRLDALWRLGAVHSPAAIWRALARVRETRSQLDANANARLALEALLLDLPEWPELSNRAP